MVPSRWALLIILALLCAGKFSLAAEATDCTCKNDTKDKKATDQAEILGNYTIGILVVLLGMSIVFEKLKDCALERAPKLAKPVVQSALGELTVLGFISLMVFIIETSKVIDYVVKATLHKDMTYPLKHLIHKLHMALFLVMVLFIVQIGIMLAVASRKGKKWGKFEAQRGRVDALANDYRQKKASVKCLLDSRLQELEYHSLRQAFIHPRQGALFDKYSAPKPPPKVNHSFDFAEYLTLGLSHTLCEMVEVGFLGWCTLLLIAVFFWLFRLVDLHISKKGASCPIVTTHVLVLSGYMLPVLLLVVSRKIKAAKRHLMPAKHQSYLGESGNVEEGSDDNLDPDHVDIPSYLHMTRPKPLHCCCFPKHKALRHDRLFWLGSHGVEFLRFFFSVELLLCSAYWGVLWAGLFPTMVNDCADVPVWSKVLLVLVHLPPPIIVLVYFVHVMAEFVLISFVEEKRDNGMIKEVLVTMKTRHVLRILKLMNAMHNATISNKLDGYLQQKQEDEQKHEDAPPKPPSAVIRLMIRRCPPDFAPVPGRDTDWTDRCAGCTSKLQEAVESGAVQLPATDVYVRSERLSMEEGTDVYFCISQMRQRKRRMTRHQLQVEESMQTYASIFDTIDVNHDGSIGHEELGIVMQKLGFKDVTNSTISILISRLDTDNDGSVDKAEFLKFFESQMSKQTQETTQQMVHNVFKYLDSDNSGSISTTEFMEVISKLDNGALTREDVEEIVRMADSDGNGEISLEELTELVEETAKNEMA